MKETQLECLASLQIRLKSEGQEQAWRRAAERTFMWPAEVDATWCMTYRLELRALKKLFKSKYWTRRWIVQEFVRARSVLLQCGANRWQGRDLVRVLMEENWYERTYWHVDETTKELYPAELVKAHCEHRRMQRPKKNVRYNTSLPLYL